jgi:hypothetical protein
LIYHKHPETCATKSVPLKGKFPNN